jgi:hypothetical protein
MDDCWIASEQLLQVQVERMTMSAFGHKRPRQAAKVDVRFTSIAAAPVADPRVRFGPLTDI